jgi:hypothetical protein
MNEIKINHSVWKNAIAIINGLTMAGLGIYVGIRDGEFPRIVRMAIVFFGLGGLFMAYMVIKDKIAHRPFLIITDEYVRMNAGKGYDIRYADVDAFFMTRVWTNKMIGIAYKKEVEARKIEEAKEVGRAVRRFITKIVGTPDAIPAYDLTMKPKEILEILNERLIAFKKD